MKLGHESVGSNVISDMHLPAETTILPLKNEIWTLPLAYFVSTNYIFFYMIMDRYIYLNQDQFITKLNNSTGMDN